MKADFFKNKTVLVTGGSGFLGSNIVNLLEKKDCRCIIVPRSKDYDLTKEDNVSKLFEDYNIDIVIHSAAIHGGIHFNIRNRGDIYFKNIIMNTFLMEYARRHNIKKFASIGTVDSYPKNASIPLKEENVWDGYPESTSAPYAFSKKMMLVQGDSYREQYGFNAIHLLLINLYGPGDEFDPEKCHVIPALIQNIDKTIETKKDEITVWGDGSQRREFLHVSDAARAIILATEYYNEGEPVNIGTGKDISIKEVVSLVASIMGFNKEIVWDTSKPSGCPRKNFNVSKAKAKFGFTATEKFEDGLRETIDWYKNHIKKKASFRQDSIQGPKF